MKAYQTGLDRPLAQGRCAPHQRAFSLIEMLGVLTIAMIVTMALVPALMNQLAKTAQDQESSTLQQIGAGYQSYVLNYHRIPATGVQLPGTGLTVFTNIASQLGWQVGTVLSNAAGNPRYYLVDPALLVGGVGISNLPFVQTNSVLACTNPPVSARGLFITSIGAPLPTVLTNPLALNSSTFNLIWNGADGAMPSGWSYGGDWTTILVQRVNLMPFFVKLMLNNHSTNIGKFSIDNTNVVQAIPGAGTSQTNYTGWLLLRTVVGLFDVNQNFQLRQVLQDTSTNLYTAMPGFAPCFCYDRDTWRGRAFASSDIQSRVSLDLQAACDFFLSGNRNAGGTLTITNPSIITSNMWTYMSNYVAWYNNSFPSSGSIYVAVTTSQANLTYVLTNYCRSTARYP